MNIRSTILAVAAAAAAFTAVSASAQTGSTLPVAYADLNLHSEAGLATLDGRIASAARKLCGEYSAFELEWSMEARACQQEVIASAKAQRDALAGGQQLASLTVSRAAF